MKHNIHAFSRTHTLNKDNQQSGLLTNFQNIVNVANEDVVNDDQTFVELLTNFQNTINVANEDVMIKHLLDFLLNFQNIVKMLQMKMLTMIKHGAKCGLKRKPQ